MHPKAIPISLTLAVRSSKLGRGISDADVEALVAINRRLAGELAGELAAKGDIARSRTRVRLAYREVGGGGFIPWLLTQLDRKGRLRCLFVPAAERGAGRPMIGASASHLTGHDADGVATRP